ncbi:MAG: bifunctional diaminohydroxyphosphoribosylaminopyrimidine deaminase/5-amino-6-(5-phosphoribosylamino)uracil reductase RibD [Pseudomonadota bacterium]
MTSKSQSERDIAYMRSAIAIASRGLGCTAPNPSVGAVLVEPKTNAVIARGWTQPGGRPHAEPNAIDRAGKAAAGATLYVTLEPCSHFGRSPPCVDSIIAAGIKRVICGLEDPDPRVAGRGIQRLREAGIIVEVGVLRKECHYLTLGHILRVTERRPFVQLKMALDAEGRVARGAQGQPTWVTGIDSRNRGHLLRAQADAILIGRQTLIDDDASLTSRLPGLVEQSPVRVILASQANSDDMKQRGLMSSHVPVWWVVGRANGAAPFSGRAQDRVLEVASVDKRPWLPAVMEVLVQNGVTRLLVEGGPTIWQAFDRANLVDEVMMFRAGQGLNPETTPFEPGQALASYVHQTPMGLVKSYPVSEDYCYVFRRGTIPAWWTA